MYLIIGLKPTISIIPHLSDFVKVGQICENPPTLILFFTQN